MCGVHCTGYVNIIIEPFICVDHQTRAIVMFFYSHAVIFFCSATLQLAVLSIHSSITAPHYCKGQTVTNVFHRPSVSLHVAFDSTFVLVTHTHRAYAYCPAPILYM